MFGAKDTGCLGRIFRACRTRGFAVASIGCAQSRVSEIAGALGSNVCSYTAEKKLEIAVATVSLHLSKE
jgi:hypothetical protein